jgi:hypothetical protein
MKNGTLMFCAAWCAVILVMTCVPRPAECVPAFSRAQEVSCTVCHTVWPQLTEDGRLFKESGFDAGSLAEIDDDLGLSTPFPISGRINLRAVDKRTSRRRAVGDDVTDQDKRTKLRALHEVEAFLAGQAGRRWSYFAEVEAEDEWPDPNDDAPGFQVQLAHGAVQYKPHEKVTVAAGYASPFFSDPYNAVNYEKPVRHEWAPASRGFTPGDGQFLSVSGRPAENVFLLAAWHANEGLLEGEDPKDFSGRLVVDVMPELSVGGYGTFSRETLYDAQGESSTGDDLIRVGGDVQLAMDKLNVHALFGIAKLEAEDSANDHTENVVAIEGSWLFPAGRTIIGPIASISRYTINDGDDSFVVGGIFANCQITANVRGQIGWEGDFSVPDELYDHKESRITAVVDVGI